MWTPISIDKFVKIHLKKNPDENEKVLRVRIEAALDDYKNGVKCQCGKDIWIVGSAAACNLNRAGRTNDEEFKCYSYEKLR